jgi:Tfp pilus assembly protein PilP
MKRNGILFLIVYLLLAGLSVTARSESLEKGVAPAAGLSPEEIQKQVADSLKGVEAVSRFQYDPSGRRDPFQSFIKPSDGSLEGLPPLQRTSVGQLRLVGVAWSSGGVGAVGAMVQTPDGKTYPVKRGTRIGTNRGRVKEIGAREVIIEEPYLNIFGRTDLKQVVMKLDKKKEGGQ